MSPEQLALRAMHYFRRGRVAQLIRVPEVGAHPRHWYLALDRNFAVEGSRPSQAVIEVGEMGADWKSAAAVPEFDPSNPAHVRDVRAIKAFEDARVRQLLWLGAEIGFVAIGAAGPVEHMDPAEAIIAAMTAKVPLHRHRRR